MSSPTPRTEAVGRTWTEWLAGRLGDLLGDEALAAALTGEPDRDLFEAGLDSLRAFRLLDDLADAGVEVDFTDFVSAASIGFLLDEIAAAGADAPR